MFRGWLDTRSWLLLVWLALLGWPVGLVTATQPEEPVGWDVLPNGLLEVQYDLSGDGIPDRLALHQVTWSGWTARPVEELEAQARMDGEWIFIVEYDADRYVYLAKDTPLLSVAAPAQRDDRTILPAGLRGRPLPDGVSPCVGCAP